MKQNKVVGAQALVLVIVLCFAAFQILQLLIRICEGTGI